MSVTAVTNTYGVKIAVPQFHLLTITWENKFELLGQMRRSGIVRSGPPLIQSLVGALRNLFDAKFSWHAKIGAKSYINNVQQEARVFFCWKNGPYLYIKRIERIAKVSWFWFFSSHYSYKVGRTDELTNLSSITNFAVLVYSFWQKFSVVNSLAPFLCLM